MTCEAPILISTLTGSAGTRAVCSAADGLESAAGESQLTEPEEVHMLHRFQRRRGRLAAVEPKEQTMKVRRLLLPVIAGCAVLGFAASASATPPEMFSFPEEGSDPHFLQCDGFGIALTTTGIGDVTVFFDDAGEVSKALVRHRVRDVFTNSVTGKTVVNRGVFQETFTPIEGTDDFTATVTGFRFMATFPGEGLVLQDVGRFEESPDGEILFVAGQHDLLPEAVEPEVICAALS
jgi:hypothetical protein